MKFYDPNGAAKSIGWNGEAYDPDENGVFDIPEEAAPTLADFGIIPGEPAPAEPTIVTVPVSQWKNVDLLAKAAELGLELAPDIKRPDLIKAVTAAMAPKE